MHARLKAKAHALHAWPVMPAGASGHPVFAFETLDSCVHAVVGNRLDLWRENDGTSGNGPQGLSQDLPNPDRG